MMALQQQTRQQQVTQTQSLAAVQTLLRAGLGCITFLRNLLPDDNFSESHFTTSDDSTPSSSQASGPSSDGSRQRISGFKIMTMARGYSEEADRILNYLEYGIFDALEKQYLRSFIFAIYLDSKDPNNIVEAYTFNFRYHKAHGSDSVVPILTFGDDLQRSDTSAQDDPVTEAAKKGLNPTLRDVKKSVKTLLKTLIHAMSQMDVLPKRRYATFKIFYTNATPSDYEPPHFQPGDINKDRWYMMTHNMDEVPDKWSIGKINTGHHSVNLNIASIATYLPSAENQEGAFAGTTQSQFTPHYFTPMQEAALRAQQNEQQEKDAETRNLVWSAETDAFDLDVDAEGEDDPDYVKQSDGSFLRTSDSHDLVLIGVRNETGVIETIPVSKNKEEAIYGGEPEMVPMHLSDLNDQSPKAATQYDETQTFAFDARNSPLPPSDPESSSPLSSVFNNPPDEDGASLLARMSLNDAIETGETCATEQDLHESAGPLSHSRQSSGRLGKKMTTNEDDKGLACECGVSIDDESCFCEGGCSKWFHIWCTGYHSTDDQRIPPKFICIDCRLRADISWELIKSELYPRLMSKYRDLALFRRALKVAERMNIMTPANFAKQLGTDFPQSRQLLKRLEEEGFVQEHVEEIDELGLVKARPKKKNTTNQTKQRRNNIQKSQYRFKRAIINTADYRKYFDPSIQAENRLLGIGEMVAKYHNRPNPPVNTTEISAVTELAPVVANTESRAQEGVISMAAALGQNQSPSRPNKRSAANDQEDRTPKKIKISVTNGVDLAE